MAYLRSIRIAAAPCRHFLQRTPQMHGALQEISHLAREARVLLDAREEKSLLRNDDQSTTKT
jgi:hypothetical protein